MATGGVVWWVGELWRAVLADKPPIADLVPIVKTAAASADYLIAGLTVALHRL